MNSGKVINSETEQQNFEISEISDSEAPNNINSETVELHSEAASTRAFDRILKQKFQSSKIRISEIDDIKDSEAKKNHSDGIEDQNREVLLLEGPSRKIREEDWSPQRQDAEIAIKTQAQAKKLSSKDVVCGKNTTQETESQTL